MIKAKGKLNAGRRGADRLSQEYSNLVVDGDAGFYICALSLPDDLPSGMLCEAMSALGFH
jgi:hypothetical protein